MQHIQPRTAKCQIAYLTGTTWVTFHQHEQPSLTVGNVHEQLKQYTVFPDGLSSRTVSRAIHTKLSKGEYTRKRMTHSYAQRFAEDNMTYSQAYIDELFSRDPHRLKNFDESGFKMPDSCNPKYGYAPKGVRCLEISRYHQTPNITLNLLISTGGVEYANTLEGGSTGMDFLKKCQDASQNRHPATGEPISVLEIQLFWTIAQLTILNLPGC